MNDTLHSFHRGAIVGPLQVLLSTLVMGLLLHVPGHINHWFSLLPVPCWHTGLLIIYTHNCLEGHLCSSDDDTSAGRVFSSISGKITKRYSLYKKLLIAIITYGDNMTSVGNYQNYGCLLCKTCPTRGHAVILSMAVSL